jgi:hypothetical protein
VSGTEVREWERERKREREKDGNQYGKMSSRRTNRTKDKETGTRKPFLKKLLFMNHNDKKRTASQGKAVDHRSLVIGNRAGQRD